MNNTFNTFKIARRIFDKGLSVSNISTLKSNKLAWDRWSEQVVRNEAGSDYRVGMACEVWFYVQFLEKQESR